MDPKIKEPPPPVEALPSAAELEKEYFEMLVDNFSNEYHTSPADLARLDQAKARMKAAQRRERGGGDEPLPYEARPQESGPGPVQARDEGPLLAQDAQPGFQGMDVEEPLMGGEQLRDYGSYRPSRWNRFKQKWDFLAYKEEPLMDLQGVKRFGGATAPVRSKFTFKEWSAGLKTRPKMTPAQRAAFTEELRTADIFVSGTGSELFVNFGKAIAGNVVMAAAMVALGFVLPKKAQKGLTYAFDALAVAELLAGNPAMALMTGGMELWKEFGVQAKREKYNIESDRDHGKVFGYVRDGKTWYPAYVDQHEKWHTRGVGERGNDIDLVYGRDLYMKILPNGSIEPDFWNVVGKRHVSGSDKDLLMSTKEVAEKQSMRDWYLLAPKDMETVTMRGQRVVKPIGEMTAYESTRCRTWTNPSCRRKRLARSTCPRGGRPIWTCAGAWTTCTTGGSGRTTSSGATTLASTRASR